MAGAVTDEATDDTVIAVDVHGEPVYDELIRIDSHQLSLVDLLTDEGGYPHGVRGWRLA